tara:strand:- start:1980 stop:2501 length:522 start_codon:yes stop_codon:yes gene_type:complete
MSPLALAQTVYTWTDNNGVLHFSDTPGGKKVKAIQMPDYQQPPPPPTFETESKVENKSREDNHQPKSLPPLLITITSPEHDQALRSNAGMITIQAELNRKLNIGEQLQLQMDGANYHAPTNRPLWELRNIDRGTHTFIIQAYRDGKLIASSSPITVHLLRSSQKKVASPVKAK